jgi:hypothetical protein
MRLRPATVSFAMDHLLAVSGNTVAAGRHCRAKFNIDFPLFYLCVCAFQKWEREMAIFGYARVSTRDQDLAGQIAELQAAGCGNIFKEKASGARTDRPELAKAIRRLEAGDVLVVRVPRTSAGNEMAQKAELP